MESYLKIAPRVCGVSRFARSLSRTATRGCYHDKQSENPGYAFYLSTPPGFAKGVEPKGHYDHHEHVADDDGYLTLDDPFLLHGESVKDECNVA